MKRSLSVIVPVMNEELNLGPTVETVLAVAKARLDDFEVIIIEDGSHDRTPQIADELAASDPHVKVYHNPHNLGLGYGLQKGFELASKEYAVWVAGNNLNPRKGLEDVFDAIGQADIIVAAVTKDTRGLFRRLVSRSVVLTLNLLFNLRFKYYNGPSVYRTADVKSVKITSHGYIAMAELLIRVVKSGRSYVEVGYETVKRTQGKTKMFRLKNFRQLIGTIWRLFWEIQVLGWFKRTSGAREQAAPTDAGAAEKVHGG